MSEKEKYEKYQKFYESTNNQQSPNNQSQTSENISKDGKSDHCEGKKEEKSYEVQNVGIKEESIKKNNNKIFSVKSCQTKEKNLIGKKRSQPDVPDHEPSTKEVCETALINTFEFLNGISLNVYKYNLNFKIIKNFIKKKNFCKTNLDKNIVEIFSIIGGLQQKEIIKNKIKTLLELELEQNNNFLPFCEDICKMKFKDLLSIYINDRIIKLNNFKLKTLDDNPRYSPKEKMEIRKQFLNSFNIQLGVSLSSNDDEETGIHIPQNLNHLPKDDIKRKIIFIVSQNGNVRDFKTPNKRERTDNLKRITIEQCWIFLIEMIRQVANDVLNGVSIYKDISSNNIEDFIGLFNLKIIVILGRTNGEFIKKILSRTDNSEETIFLKSLFTTKFLDIIDKFINDKDYKLKRSNGVEVIFKTFKDFQNDDKINKKREDIKKLIIKIIKRARNEK